MLLIIVSVCLLANWFTVTVARKTAFLALLDRLRQCCLMTKHAAISNNQQQQSNSNSNNDVAATVAVSVAYACQQNHDKLMGSLASISDGYAVML